MPELNDLLDVDDVMRRYRVRERRTARAIMDRAGSFKVGHALFVRSDDLLAFEQRLRDERRPGGMQPKSLRAGTDLRRQGDVAGPLPPAWWSTGKEAA